MGARSRSSRATALGAVAAARRPASAAASSRQRVSRASGSPANASRASAAVATARGWSARRTSAASSTGAAPRPRAPPQPTAPPTPPPRPAVPPPAEGIEQAEGARVELDRHGVHGEATPAQVLVDGGGHHAGQRAPRLVPLGARRRHVDTARGGRLQGGRQEALVLPQRAAELAREPPGDRGPVALDHDVEGAAGDRPPAPDRAEPAPPAGPPRAVRARPPPP